MQGDDGAVTTEELDLGEVAVEKKNRAVKSKIAMARSRKSAIATLAIALADRTRYC